MHRRSLTIVCVCVCVCVCRRRRASLKVLGTVGEPINPEAWQWYYNVVGEKRCPIVDTFWQTETVGTTAVVYCYYCSITILYYIKITFW